MNAPRPPRLARLALALALLAGPAALAVAPAPAAAQQQPASGGITVGVVDFDRIAAESQLRKSLEEQVKTYQTQVQDQINQRQAEIQTLQARLQELQPATDTARQVRQQLTVKNGEVQALRQTGQQEIQLLLSQMELRLFKAINKATVAVAQERNFTFVIRKSPPLPDTYNPQDAQRTQEAMARQVVLYASPGVDITTAVLLKMDEDFKTNPSGEDGNGGGTAPATGNP